MAERGHVEIGIAAGDGDYRAFVGPPERYDLLSISQVALLHHFGLREQHRVLDFGCGSLRLGRMLLPFLQPGRYFGIEPNQWLIEEGFSKEAGQDVRALKRPRFSNNTNFDCGVFGESFEFIVAQSIITHTGREETASLIASAGETLAGDGRLLFSFIDDARGGEPPLSGWVYPDCVRYAASDLDPMFVQAKLRWRALSWPHPGATWAVAARSQQALSPLIPI